MVKKCDDFSARLILYLDNELQGSESRLFKTHLEQCAACRAVFGSESTVADAVRRSGPLHQASPELRARVAEVLAGSATGLAAPALLRRRLQRLLVPGTFAQGRRLRWQYVSIAAISVLLAPFLVSYLRNREQTSVNPTSEFALMAAGTHLRRTRGQLPLEITSSSPPQISRWFADKVAFSVKLPNYQEASGQEKLYRLEGARLVGYKNDYAAYVAYQMKARPISLVITSDAAAVPAGGEEIRARGLTFHYNAINGLKVITWSDRGLTYALVSDLEERGQQSCIVCHEGTKDQDFIAPLKPH